MVNYAHPLDLKLKRGALHRELHVPQGSKISHDKLEKALGSKNPLEAKRARLAETMSKWNHGGK
jgi:hypothetical protein